MSEIQTNDTGGKKKKGGSKQKKISVFVDFTPMVDMNMLLITFFMLCTSLSKPQTMEINMPSNDKKITEADKSTTARTGTVGILCMGKPRTGARCSCSCKPVSPCFVAGIVTFTETYASGA